MSGSVFITGTADSIQKSAADSIFQDNCRVLSTAPQGDFRLDIQALIMDDTDFLISRRVGSGYGANPEQLYFNIN